MKSHFWIAIALIGFSTHLTAQTIVSGSISPGKSYDLELHAYNVAKNEFVKDRDLQLSKTGVFKFEIPAEPNMYQLCLPGKGCVDFINDNDKLIEIGIDMKSSTPFTFNGSQASQHFLEYNNLVGKLQTELLYPLEPLMKKALKEDDKDQLEALEQKHQENLKIFVGQLAAKIESMGTSLAVYAISIGLDFNKYLDTIESWSKKFEAEKPDSPFTKKFVEMVASAKRLRVGAKAPELALQTTEERPISVSKLNNSGKVILIDFWASWCLPCRKENREFKEIIKGYSDSEFVIWSVSLDKNEKAWKKAMQKDDMPWLQSRTIDNAIINTYQATTLPTNFLIDEYGIIRAKNVKAADLKGALDPILNK